VGLFTRSKTTKPAAKPQAVSAGKKIVLNFGGRSSTAVGAMAAATLEAGGFDPAIAEPKPTVVGDKMPDGTIYAGASPDTGKPMYTTPDDAPLLMSFNKARKYARKLDAHGHRDWRVPTKGELSVLFAHSALIGGFNKTGLHRSGLFTSDWYWSSSSSGSDSSFGDDDAWGENFSAGTQLNLDKGGPMSVRCVRCAK
jgi:uncharacterized protein DUF1566